jgi:hypothetical protein
VSAPHSIARGSAACDCGKSLRLEAHAGDVILKLQRALLGGVRGEDSGLRVVSDYRHYFLEESSLFSE